MSATGRSEARIELDAYNTPSWCVRRLLEACELPRGYWLEPGAGDGAIILAVDDPSVKWTAIEKRSTNVPQPPFGDSEESGNWWITGDFLDPKVFELHQRVMPHKLRAGGIIAVRFDVVIGNPPYKLARKFIEQALKYAPIVAFLLRLNFLGGKRRLQFWQDHPADAYVLPDRPSFSWTLRCKNCSVSESVAIGYTGSRLCFTCGAKRTLIKSDATEYAWFVWGMCGEGPGRIYHLAATPESERRAVPTRIIDVADGETETAAKMRHEEAIKSKLIADDFYVLEDGRLAKFEGFSKQFAFFECWRGDETHKLRFETMTLGDVVGAAEGDPVECPDCRWMIAIEAANASDACPYCSKAA